MDDFEMIIYERPTDRFVYWCLLDGRYVLVLGLRAFQAIGIDVLKSYTVFAVLYACAFAFFCQSAVDYLTRNAGLRPDTVRLWTVLSGALVLTHGFYGDLIAWKNVFPIMLMMLVPVAICLRSLARQPLTLMHGGRLSLLLLITNMIYQPGTSTVLFLAFGWVLVTALSAGNTHGRALRPYAQHVAAIVSIYAVAGAGYIAMTHIVRAITDIQSDRPFTLAAPGALLVNIKHHIKQIIGVFDPTGWVVGPYSGGPVAIVALTIVGILAWTAVRRERTLPAGLGLAGLVLLAANPQNIVLAGYWPSLRSSFYVSLLVPVLLIAARAAASSRYWQVRSGAVAAIVLALQTTLFVRLSAERIELQRRDLNFAQRIADAIETGPSTRDLTSVRLPDNVPASFYRGLLPPILDTNRSVLAFSPWANEAVLYYASGRHYTRVGDSDCRAHPESLDITVRRDGDVAVVCY